MSKERRDFLMINPRAPFTNDEAVAIPFLTSEFCITPSDQIFVRGYFAVNEKQVLYRTVLIDDVYTTMKTSSDDNKVCSMPHLYRIDKFLRGDRTSYLSKEESLSSVYEFDLFFFMDLPFVSGEGLVTQYRVNYFVSWASYWKNQKLRDSRISFQARDTKTGLVTKAVDNPKFNIIPTTLSILQFNPGKGIQAGFDGIGGCFESVEMDNLVIL